MALLAGMPGIGPLRKIGRAFHRNFPPLNFITLHYIYFLVTCMIASVIFWGSSTPARSISYTDSLFFVVSAMTLAGLNTVNLSTLNTFQQFILFFLIMIGSAIFVSAFVVHVRKRAFEKRFNFIAEVRHHRAQRSSRMHGSTSLMRRFSRNLTRPKSSDAGPSSKMLESDRTDGMIEATLASTNTFADQGNNTNNDANPMNEKVQNLNDQSDIATAEGKDTAMGRQASLPEIERETAVADPSAPDQPKVQNENPTTSYHSSNGDAIHIDTDDVAIDTTSPLEHITFGPDTYFRRRNAEQSLTRHHHSRYLNMQGVGAHPNASIKSRSTSLSRTRSEEFEGIEGLGRRAKKYLPFTSSGYMSRNSQFHHLTEAERERLGGCEYKAIQLLSWLVPAYFILWQLLSCLGIGAYIANNRVSTARMNGLNPWWVGSFNAVSAFNNSGMSLLDANMVAFQTSIYMLITMALLILAGNTCYPIFLRLIVWTLWKLTTEEGRWSEWNKTLRFLLDHPRRCYTNMFPKQHTWWLLFSVVCLNTVDWAAFEILNIGNEAITSLPKSIEVLDGLFQAVAVRSGGFYVVPIPTVRISLQVLYVVMMYISVYPVVITMRNSNVYEERSLGIYADDPGYDASQSSHGKTFFGKLRRTVTNRPFEQTKSYFVRQQLRAQLAHDLWWIVLAIFLIMIVEGSNFQKNPTVFSVFNVIFETVSAYGCVGISVGVPDEAYSFCGAWHGLSKLILCAVMIRGRHRGLPVAIDKAVLLPGEDLHDAEEEDAMIRMERTVSRGGAV